MLNRPTFGGHITLALLSLWPVYSQQIRHRCTYLAVLKAIEVCLRYLLADNGCAYSIP